MVEKLMVERRMNVAIRLKEVDVHKLHYQLIAETTNRSVWNTGRRTRKMEMEFTKEERKDVETIIQMSRRWASCGVPKEVCMDTKMLILWKRLVNFCYEL